MTRAADSPSPDEAYPQLGRELKVSFACPGCQREGWVCWEHLRLGMRCPACDCRFQIGPDGKLHSQHGTLRVQFSCPRCGHVGAASSTAMLHGAECLGCGLQLLPGPDRQLYGPQELAAAQRLAREEAVAEAMRWRPSAKPEPSLRAIPRWSFAVGGGIVALLLGGLCLGLLARDDSCETAALRFTQYCLDGDWEHAQASLVDNEFQRMEFERWRIMHFASIISKVRPPGDDVEVVLQLAEEREAEHVIQVRLISEFFGERRHVQRWKRDEVGWHFDVAASLKQSSNS
ncbi:MAG: hypothetical protein KF708_04860 [Pirellulales bacterium]|nr:hypothetical protein [Pirellulales bacterium]